MSIDSTSWHSLETQRLSRQPTVTLCRVKLSRSPAKHWCEQIGEWIKKIWQSMVLPQAFKVLLSLLSTATASRLSEAVLRNPKKPGPWLSLHQDEDISFPEHAEIITLLQQPELELGQILYYYLLAVCKYTWRHNPGVSQITKTSCHGNMQISRKTLENTSFGDAFMIPKRSEMGRGKRKGEHERDTRRWCGAHEEYLIGSTQLSCHG